jgi:hypothetical protein
MAFSIKSSKSAPKSVPTPPMRARMVPGSVPPGMRSPRIKPLEGQRNYGKAGALNPMAVGQGFGDTMKPMEP